MSLAPPGPSGSQEPRDVVFTFSTETWEDAVRRDFCRPPDRLLQTLLTSPRVRRLLVVNPWRSGPLTLAKRVLGNTVSPFPATDDHRLLSPLRLARRDPTAVGELERWYAEYSGRLGEAAAAAGMERPAVVTFHPLVAGFAPLDWAGSVTYYARDDWEHIGSRRDYWPAYREARTRIRARGLRVCAVSDVLLRRLDPPGPRAVIPNGVAESIWADPGPPAPAVLELPAPRIVYAGTIDDRLDLEAMAAVAEEFRGGSIVVAGYCVRPSLLASLRRLPAVHVLGALKQRQLATALRAADACVMPHHRNPLTEAMSPLKLYEYLAAGRPVAANDFEPVRGLGDRVVLVDDRAQFPAAVRQALEVGPADEGERRRFVEENRWSLRHRDVLDLAFGPAAST